MFEEQKWKVNGLTVPVLTTQPLPEILERTM